VGDRACAPGWCTQYTIMDNHGTTDPTLLHEVRQIGRTTAVKARPTRSRVFFLSALLILGILIGACTFVATSTLSLH
jgi:hypothetical protein